jgi:protease YdgD
MSWRGVIAACVLGITPTLAAADGSGLTRLTQRGELLGWEAVGRLDMASGFCTGTLIAPDLVLTAAHCLYDGESGQMRDTSQMVFRAGYRDGKAIAEVRVARGVAPQTYQPLNAPKQQNIRNDVALLQLAQSIPAITAAPFALHSGSAPDGKISVVSYGRGRAEALSWQRECSLLDRAYGMMAFDCDVTFGSSGAPVFANENGRARILSLISAGVMEGDERLSYGMELPNLVTELKQQLRALPAARASGTLSGNAKRIKVNGGRASGAKFVRAPGG